MNIDSSYAIISYKKINIIFSLIILLIFLYCFLFPYLPFTINSSCEGLPLVYCKSRGLTRAFGEILSLNFEKALQYNSSSIQVFSFFLFQLFTRIAINIIIDLRNYNKIIYLDSAFSVVFFIFSFYKLLITT